jgi:Leucine-rich repeat (LRR) protein
MYGNAFSGPIPSEIGALTALHTLDLSENKFSGTLPAELSRLRNLSMFAVHQTDGKLGGPLPAFDTFPYLKGLFLASNKFEGQIPQSFLKGIIDKSVEMTISLASNNLTGTLPESLNEFDKLILDLENNQITE